jgi:ribosome biogenesis protein Tsr3
MTKEKKRAGMPVGLGSEEDLDQLRKSTKKTYEALHDADENDFPPERRQEYWRNRHLARTAWEHAENAVFANLVEEQKRRLPAVAASNAKLAKDVQAAANVLAMLDLVTASLSVLAEVITLLARAMLK